MKTYRDENAPASTLSQTITATSNQTYTLTFDLGAGNGESSGFNFTASLEIWLDGVRYAKFDNPAASNGGVTLTLYNGAISNYSNASPLIPVNNVNVDGNWRNGITITINHTVPTTGADNRLRFVHSATGDDWYLDNISLLGGCDTDGDGIPDYLDLDSDNDGCLDAMEGDENVTTSQLVNAGGTVTVGIGSTANNQNLCADGSCVDAQGVPMVVNVGGTADVGNDQGQGVGDSQNAAISTACATTACYKPGATGTPILDSKVGITSLSRAGAANADNWPMARKGAWLVLESKTKGFVPNRVAFNASNHPIIEGGSTKVLTSPVEGMMVYDKTNKCLKVYTSTDGGLSFGWYCMSTQACPD